MAKARRWYGGYLTPVKDNYRITVPGQLREELGLHVKSTCVFVGRSEQCVSLWALETWDKQIQSRMDAVRDSSHPAVRMDHLLTLHRWRDAIPKAWVDERGRIGLPTEFRTVVERDPEDQAEGSVLVVGCGLCIEIWRPTAWVEFRKTQWPKLWEAIDAAMAAPLSGG